MCCAARAIDEFDSANADRQVYALSEAIPPCYRSLVLLATFTSLRWRALCALRRKDIDRDTRTVRIERTLTELQTAS